MTSDRVAPIPASEWYASLGAYGFPTVFIRLHPDECRALAGETGADTALDALVARLNPVIKSLPGKSFVHADTCAPSDSELWEKCKGAVSTGRKAVDLLLASAKTRAAFAAGETERLALHPYRRMDRVREFRIFFYERQLAAMSQLNLERHFARFEGRRTVIWRRAQALAEEIADWLPRANVTVDVYLTSKDELMIIDLNPWGPPTDPLLLRDWEQDWKPGMGLRLIPSPVKLGGDVEVSF